MELIVGLLGVLVGTISGGFSAFLTNRNKMRQELEYAYDRELRIRRMEVYTSLYRRTDKYPRYHITILARKELVAWAHSFDDWYFGEAGGLFLSNNARQAYLSMLDVTATVANDDSSGERISEEEVQLLWRAGQALRRQLAADIGAAENPRLTFRPPAMSPPPATRFKDESKDSN
jgi:hypothetical protein